MFLGSEHTTSVDLRGGGNTVGKSRKSGKRRDRRVRDRERTEQRQKLQKRKIFPSDRIGLLQVSTCYTACQSLVVRTLPVLCIVLGFLLPSFLGLSTHQHGPDISRIEAAITFSGSVFWNFVIMLPLGLC